MRNPPAAYKHDDPTHKQYGQSANSSLLNKRRQNFAAGGGAFPVAGAKGSARWMGAGPEHYASMRAEMSPSDFATFQKNVSPAEYNTFMGVGTPSTPGLDTSASATNPSIQGTMDLANRFGINPGSQQQSINSVSGSGPVPLPGGGTAPASYTRTTTG